MPKELDCLIKDIDQLISLPEVCLTLNSLVSNPASSMQRIADVISRDPALTAKLLRIANSPVYALPRQVDTITRAVSVLGMRQIRDLTLAACAAGTFRHVGRTIISVEKFWRHSVYCALAAAVLARENRRTQGESLFVAGLLHDVGRLVIGHAFPDTARNMMLIASERSERFGLMKLEKELLGFDHSDVGARLLTHWQLPDSIVECVQYHHRPSEAPHHFIEAAFIHLANAIAHLISCNSTSLDDAPPIKPVTWDLTGLDQSIVIPVINEVMVQFDDIWALFRQDVAA
jgi:putative nucleotidyltransferase with HDIG domain